MVVRQWQKSKRESDKGCQRSSDRVVEAWQTSCSGVAEKQFKVGRAVVSARLEGIFFWILQHFLSLQGAFSFIYTQ